MGLKERKPWIAGLLSIICLGLGHLYSGEARKGITYCAILFFSFALFGIIGIWESFTGMVAFAALFFSYYIFVVSQAVRTAKSKGKMELKWYNRWYVYLLIYLTIGLPFLLVDEDTLKGKVIGYEAFKIPSVSMHPTLHLGDHFYVNRKYYNTHAPRRGDVVVFTRPEDPQIKNIKRIVGLPGDIIEHRKHQLYINSELYPESYATYEQGGIDDGDFSPITVPAGKLFLMGDNRDRSKDSRFWEDPFIPIENLKGKALYIYWSWSDFKRVGMNIQ